MTFFGLGRGDALLRAGRYADAETAFVREGQLGQALAVALLAADGERDAVARLAHLARARSYAAEGTDAAGAREIALRYHRARQSILLASPPGSTQRAELAEIGRAFEALEALEDAASAYTAAEDRIALARVFGLSGDIERLEFAMLDQQLAERRARHAAAARAEAVHLAASGQRRAARDRLALALREQEDPDLARQLAALERGAAPLRGCVVEEEGEAPWTWIFGEQVVVGRGEASDIQVNSPVVSRRHLVLGRGPEGVPTVTILGHGTSLAGASVEGELPIRGYLELALGTARCSLEPLAKGGLLVVTTGRRFRVALGAVQVGPFIVRPWGDGLRLDAGSGLPYLEGVTACPEGIDLARGDRVAEARGGPFLLRLLD